MESRAVGDDDSTRDALEGHERTRYGSKRVDASMPSPLLVTAVAVVSAVWWSDVLVDPIEGLDRRRLGASALFVVVLGSIWIGRRRVDRRRVDRRRVIVASLVMIASVLACWRGIVEWSVQGRPVSGRVVGVVRVVDDPEFRGRAIKVVVDDGRDRLEAYGFGAVGRRLSRVSAGELIVVDGTRRSIDVVGSRRQLLRHVTGRIDIARVDLRPIGVEREGGGLDRAANRVRDALTKGSRVLADRDRALLLGFLVGDDRFQSRETILAFRSSGLAHLTAVSGQNVAFVLAIVTPLLSRMSRGARVGVTLVVLAWFAVLTRAEPSVVRAVMMAGATVIGSALEWRRRGLDVLSSAIVIGVIVDPFLVWSIGWWLSVGGCVGLALVAPRVESRLGSGRVARAVSPTIGAQLGVLPVSALVFGWPSAWSLPCNLLAGPIAGTTMLVGLPVTLVSAAVPDGVASLLMAPIAAAVRWVDTVAGIGARLDVTSVVDALVALLLPVMLVVGRTRRTGARPTGVATSSHERSPRSRF